MTKATTFKNSLRQFLGALGVLGGLLLYTPAYAQTIEGDVDNAPAIVQQIETYLNNITTLQAHFGQANQDGSIDTGTFYLRRPGRLRFEYAAPKKDYIVADGLLVHYWDDEVKNYSNAPIGSTLADFLLRKKISLNDDLRVTALRRPQPNKIVLTMIQRKTPEAGDVRLLLNENPLQLEKWRVTDGAGNVTEVSLSDIQSNVKLDPRLFIFKPPAGHEKDLGGLNN